MATVAAVKGRRVATVAAVKGRGVATVAAVKGRGAATVNARYVKCPGATGAAPLLSVRGREGGPAFRRGSWPRLVPVFHLGAGPVRAGHGAGRAAQPTAGCYCCRFIR